MKWPWRWRTSKGPEPARERQEAPAPLEMPAPAPLRVRVSPDGPAKVYCTITRVKAKGRVLEHHSVCSIGEHEVPTGAVHVTTGHWV